MKVKSERQIGLCTLKHCSVVYVAARMSFHAALFRSNRGGDVGRCVFETDGWLAWSSERRRLGH